MTTENKKVTKEVKVSKIAAPKFVTLTEMPANQVAFKIVRRDRPGVKPKVISRQRPVRRMAPTLVMTFPLEATEEQIKALMDEFGIDDYKAEKGEDGWIVRRADLESLPTSYVTIHLKDGVKALVAQGEVVASDTDPLPHISVAAIEFDKSVFADENAVKEWFARNEVDISDIAFDNTQDSAVVAIRHKIEPDTETKRCRIDEGIEVLVVKAAKHDVPPLMVEAVSEVMYGTWGWGQLDFAAALADIEFSQVAREGADVLHRIIENILFYSPLPLSVRKELIERATTQFAAFVGALLDALPARVLVSQTTDKESTMNKKEEKKEVTQTDAERKASDLKAAKEYLALNAAEQKLDGKTDEEIVSLAATIRTEKEKAEKPVTRAEVDGIVKESLAAVLPGALSTALAGVFAPQQRKDEGKGEEKPENKEVDLGKQIGDAMRSAVEPISKAMESMTNSVSELAERVKKVEGATTVRSDEGDTKQSGDKPDVFKGLFARGGKKAA